MRLVAQNDLPRLHTKLANLARSTIHVAVVHEVTSKSKFAKRMITFANLPSLQTCFAGAPFLTASISRAPTSVVPSRRACRVEREVSFFLQTRLPCKVDSVHPGNHFTRAPTSLVRGPAQILPAYNANLPNRPTNNSILWFPAMSQRVY